MAWDPAQYLKFSDERLRPGFDLLAQVGLLPPGALYELGCGTGVHARAIHARWPDRVLTAIDRSREMLAQASAEPAPIVWREDDIGTWSAPEKAALVYSNATLQWLEHHDRLFPRLMGQVAPGGVLAVQMPRNFDQPSHLLMRELALEGPWADALAPLVGASDGDGGNSRASLLRRDPVAPPGDYYDLLAPLARSLNLWETEYLHVLEGDDPILEWVRGTALRPVLEALHGAERDAFLAAYAAQLRQAYPRRADGKTLFPFRRLFIVARA
jgi:trans-aconitate 2-methyltransferase